MVAQEMGYGLKGRVGAVRCRLSMCARVKVDGKE